MPKYVHGRYGTPEYEVWHSMKARCLNPKDQRFRNYGARGITVCRRWAESFQAFFDDMGQRPSPTHQIDRIDNDGNYEPGNCRWATKAQNTNNRRITVKVTHNGTTKPLKEWCAELGLNYETAIERISKRGWDPVDAITRGVQWKNKPIEFRGKTQSLTEWANETGIKYSTLRKRIVKLGQPLEKALTAPTRRKATSAQHAP